MELVKPARKVLLVDDDPDLADSMALFLNQHGYQTYHWGRSDGVVEVALREEPGLILLDLMLAPQGGFRTLMEIREEPLLIGVPVLLMTGMGDEAALQRGLSMGAAGILRKPFEPDTLMKTVGKFFGGTA